MKRGPQTDIEGENPSPTQRLREESNALSEDFERLTLAQEQLRYESRDVFQNFIYSYLDIAELAVFLSVCRQTREWTEYERETRAASPFLQYVVQGNQDQVQ